MATAYNLLSKRLRAGGGLPAVAHFSRADETGKQPLASMQMFSGPRQLLEHGAAKLRSGAALPTGRLTPDLA